MNIDVVTKPEDVGKLLQTTPSPGNNIDTGLPPAVEEILARIEAEKATKTPVPIKVEMEQTPLKLRYQWSGVDEKGHSVKTIMLDTEAGSYCIAYCISCDKEIKSVKVAKLPETEVKSAK